MAVAYTWLYIPREYRRSNFLSTVFNRPANSWHARLPTWSNSPVVNNMREAWPGSRHPSLVNKVGRVCICSLEQAMMQMFTRWSFPMFHKIICGGWNIQHTKCIWSGVIPLLQLNSSSHHHTADSSRPGNDVTPGDLDFLIAQGLCFPLEGI